MTKPFFGLLLILLPVALSFGGETDSFPDIKQICSNSPTCDLVATKAPWPPHTSYSDNTPRLSMGHFSFVQPPGVLEVANIWGETPGFTLKLNDNGQFNITELSLGDLLKNNVCFQSDSPAVEFARFLFLQRPTSSAPKTQCAQTTRRLAFFTKASSLFAQASKLHFFSNGDWIVYTAKVEGIDHDAIIVATHKQKPFHYLQVLSRGIKRESLETFINTLQIK